MTSPSPADPPKSSDASETRGPKASTSKSASKTTGDTVEGASTKSDATRKKPSRAAAKKKTSKPPVRASKSQKTETAAAAAASVKRGPGRPRKAESAAASAAKRRPGRPRKAESAAASSAKRGPGRPRKSESAASATIKRGPGRPRKTESAATATKRRPGRPRKSEIAALLTPDGAHAETNASTTHWPGDLGRQSLAFVQALLNATQASAAFTSDDVLTPKEVGDLVRVREKEVLAAIERGELRATRIGAKLRITRQSVAAWLNS